MKKNCGTCKHFDTFYRWRDVAGYASTYEPVDMGECVNLKLEVCVVKADDECIEWEKGK